MVQWKDLLPRWQTLDGLGDALGVPRERPTGGDESFFQLPTAAGTLERVSDARIRTNCVPADCNDRRQVGRRKGTVEEIQARKERLSQEVASGARTGVSTTPLDEDTRVRGVGRGAKFGQKRCLKCTGEKGRMVLITDCGGAPRNHEGRITLNEAQVLKQKKSLEEAQRKVKELEAQLARAKAPCKPVDGALGARDIPSFPTPPRQTGAAVVQDTQQDQDTPSGGVDRSRLAGKAPLVETPPPAGAASLVPTPPRPGPTQVQDSQQAGPSTL